ncbi:MAG: tetratricopeptide repeat protein [Planctomycetales bacterium]|nr:tetratricopeptide repeat protein [Planctomycetales bacterium]
MMEWTKRHRTQILCVSSLSVIVLGMIAGTRLFDPRYARENGQSTEKPSNKSDADLQAGLESNETFLPTEIEHQELQRSTNTDSTIRVAQSPLTSHAGIKSGDAFDLPTQAARMEPDKLEQRAIEIAQALVVRYPQDAEPLHIMALLKARLKQSLAAEQLWQTCIEISPASKYLTNYASIAMNRGESQLAVDMLTKYASITKDDDVIRHLATALLKTGRADEAEQWMLKATPQSAKSPPMLQTLAQIQLELGKAEEAEANLRKALAMDSESANAIYSLSMALARQGKRVEAAEAIQRYKKLQSSVRSSSSLEFESLAEKAAIDSTIQVLTDCAAFYAQQGDLHSAEHLLMELLSIRPADEIALQALATIFGYSKDFGKQCIVLQRIAELEPQNIFVRFQLADSQALSGEPLKAIETLSAAISLEPKRLEGYSRLAQLYLAQQRPTEAVDIAQRAAQVLSTADSFELLAYVYDRAGRSSEAFQAQSQASLLRGEK